MTGQRHDSSTTDVLIVGAGPTGLTMAAELTRHGVRCRIIDKAPAPAAESRAIGIVSRTLEVFEAVGVAEAVLRVSLRLRAASVFAGNQRLLYLAFDGLDSPYPFAAVLPQSDTEQLLAAHLAGVGVMVEREVELIGLEQQAEAVTARLRHRDGGEEMCRTQWLIGCNGAHSAVRRTLGVSFTGVRYEEAFLLADVRMRSDLPHDQSWSFYHRAGQLLFFPLPNASSAGSSDALRCTLCHWTC